MQRPQQNHQFGAGQIGSHSSGMPFGVSDTAKAIDLGGAPDGKTA
jgi:hypothetical protein